MNEIKTTAAQALLFKRLAAHNIHRFDEDKNLYKYVTIETAKLILNNGSLKFSTPEELNDNDLEMCLFNVNLNHKQIQRLLKSNVKRGLKIHKGLDNKGVKNIFKKYPPELMSIDDEAYKQIIIEGYKEQHKNVGLFCATTSNNNGLMWDKYANKGTGICIEYKFPTLFNTHYFTFKVHYDSEFKPYDLYDKKCRQDDVALYRWLFTKRMEYSFEDEVRIMAEYNSRILTFPKMVFTGVYYGKETSQQDIDDIELMIENAGYSFDKGVRVVY